MSHGMSLYQANYQMSVYQAVFIALQQVCHQIKLDGWIQYLNNLAMVCSFELAFNWFAVLS